MSRYLLLLLLVLAAVWWLRRVRRPQAPARPQTPAQPAQPDWRAMVRCTECGIHFPAADAVRDADARPYCCPAHRERHALRPPKD